MQNVTKNARLLDERYLEQNRPSVTQSIWDHYASVGGATGHTVVVLCICVSVCLSVGRISRRSLKTKR